MSYNFESEVPEALGQLLKTEEDYNVIIHIGEEPNFKEFHAHSNILRCRSEYFNKILSSENIERKDGKYIIKKSNIYPQAFEIILKYIYTGKFNITNKAGTELLDFMIISDEMMLKKLTKLTEDFIVKNQQQFLQNDPVGILQIVYYYKNNLKSANVVYSKTGDKSIQCNSSFGPIFGVDLYIHYGDTYNTCNTWTSDVYSYPTLNLPNSFKADDYEVFQVIKK
ncbi:uncharacterized protein OCT59_004970 [Rhizophagus irregularis]|uniref:uncharacterized protein n=1 Tax=Rhizophagus irregularis TaxID=588596 RepID=UPI003316BBA8|nr:hypothetical protein OCT59_004970 [Rhizophagus irregularis]